MLEIVKLTLTLWGRTLPRLVALYLTGWFLRFWALKGAIAVGLAHGPVWGGLVLAVVPMIRLAMYIAMFLVIRSAAPEMSYTDETGEAPPGVFEIALSTVLPFLVIYTAWKLIMEDYFVYITTVSFTTVYQGSASAVAALLKNDLGQIIWIIIPAAFALRQVLTRFRERLPRWTTVLTVYCEVLWIFLVFQAGAAAIFATPKWIGERRAVVWLKDIRDDLFDHFQWLGQLWSAITEPLSLMLAAGGLALAWLAIAGVVYGTPLPPTWAGARDVFLGRRAGEAATRAVERGRNLAQPRWARIPTDIRERVTDFLRGQLGRFAPVIDSARLILHGGLLPISFFIAAYTGLVLLSPGGAYFSATVSDGLAFRWIAEMIGPHNWAWWQSFADTIRLAISAVIDPLRIALVAATYCWCVEQVRGTHEATITRSVQVESQHDG